MAKLSKNEKAAIKAGLTLKEYKASKKASKKLSKRERAARKAGLTLKEYKASKKHKKKKKKKKKEPAKRDEKKAKKRVKKYYKEKKGDVTTEAETETKRYQEDLDKILKEAGIMKTRAMEDYLRNMTNISANKAADVEDINYYISTQRGRTQEDLGMALAKEERRYTIEQDRINQSLADKGLTFSERTPERMEKERTAEAQKEFQVVAQRSFQDVSRYEATKNRDVQLRYGQLEEEAGTTKERTLENILSEQAEKAQRIQRGKEDIAFGKAIDIRDIAYESADVQSSIGNYYEQQRAELKDRQLRLKVQGT